MRITEHRIERLVGLGLTDTQARAYLALLDLGPASIGEVARGTGVPRTRLYPVFTELHRLSLVDALAGEPMRYAPRSLEGYLEGRLQGLQAERLRLEAEAAELLREFRPPAGLPASGGHTKVFQGRKNALLHLAEAIEGSREGLVLACARHTIARLRASGLDAALAARVGAGVGVELLLPPQAELQGALAGLPSRVAVLHRVAGASPVEVLLADGKGTVAWVPRPDDGSATDGDDEGVASTSPAMYALFSAALVGLASGPAPRGVARHERA